MYAFVFSTAQKFRLTGAFLSSLSLQVRTYVHNLRKSLEILQAQL